MKCKECGYEFQMNFNTKRWGCMCEYGKKISFTKENKRIPKEQNEKLAHN